MLNVFYDVSTYGGNTRGPTKVVENLLQALSDCNIQYSENKEIYDHNIFLGWDDVTCASYNSLQNKKMFSLVLKYGLGILVGNT